MKAKKVCAIAQYWTGKEEPLIDEAIAEILAVEDKVVFYTTGDSTIVNYISSILPALKEKFPKKKLSITETSSLGKCDYLIAYYYDLVPDRYNKVLNKVKKFKQSHPETKIFHLYFEDIQDKITEAYNKQIKKLDGEPKNKKEIFSLFSQGYSFSEIEQITGIKALTAKDRIRFACYMVMGEIGPLLSKTEEPKLAEVVFENQSRLQSSTSFRLGQLAGTTNDKFCVLPSCIGIQQNWIVEFCEDKLNNNSKLDYIQYVNEKLEENGFVIPYTYRVLQAVNTSDEEAFLEDYKKYSNSVMLTGRKDLPRYTTPLYDKLFPDDISTIESWLLDWKANKNCVSFEELMHKWGLYDDKPLWTEAELQLLQNLLNSFDLDALNAKKAELATSIMCQVLNLISDRHWTCEKKIYDWKLQYVWYNQTTLSQECNEKVLCLEKVLERISAEYAKQSYLFDIIDCVTNTQVGTFRSSDYDMETIRIDVSLAFNVSPDSLDVQFLDLK